jgi:hypothetical protein
MNRRLWTEHELAVVRELYPHRPTAEIAKRLGHGRTVDKVHAIANKLGIHKTREFLLQHCRIRPGQKIGAAFCYPKGHVPANKGLRRPGFGPGRMKETQFKKGQRPPNKCEIGELRLNADGYVDMKVCEAKGANAWRALHTLLWEDEYGPVPAGHALRFKDKDKLNVDVENNLELVTRAALCRRNSIHNLPPKLKKTIHMLGAIKRRIRREEQNRGLAQSSFRDARRPSRQRAAAGR